MHLSILLLIPSPVEERALERATLLTLLMPYPSTIDSCSGQHWSCPFLFVFLSLWAYPWENSDGFTFEVYPECIHFSLYHDFSGQASNRPCLNECKGLLSLLPSLSKDFTDICQGITNNRGYCIMIPFLWVANRAQFPIFRSSFFF